MRRYLRGIVDGAGLAWKITRWPKFPRWLLPALGFKRRTPTRTPGLLLQTGRVKIAIKAPSSLRDMQRSTGFQFDEKWEVIKEIEASAIE
jgi:hypothetical protein